MIARLNVGGPAVHATLLTRHLDPTRYRTLLIAGTEEPGEGSHLELHGESLPDLQRVPALGRELRLWRDTAALGQLVRVIRAYRPHIVHTHTAKAGTLGRTAAWLCRVPVVVHTYHGHVLSGYFAPPRERLFLGIERWLGRRSHRLVAVSPQVRRELLAMGVGTPDRFDVVPLGLDLDHLTRADVGPEALRRELALPESAPTVGIVARLAPIKAHELFFDAAARVAQAIPDARFIVVGDGERRRELEEMVQRLGLGARTHFLGWRRDLERVYAGLDVVTLTSKNEGSPVALIEAMAAARPVVATRVGGVPDVVADGRTGMLAASGDAAALASHIVAILCDTDLARRLGEAARQAVLPAYSSTRLLSDVDALYQRLLAEAGVTAGSRERVS